MRDASNLLDGTVDASRVLPEARSSLPRRIREQIAMVLYWGAIVLPVFYVPLLFIRIETTAELLLFLGLFGLHVVSLVGGRSHRRPLE